jgi:hypothetical protein
VDDWKLDSDYQYGYDHLYEENRPTDAVDGTDEPSEALYWEDEEQYEYRKLDAIRKEEEALEPEDDEARKEVEAVLSILKDLPLPPEPADPQKESGRKKLVREMKAEALDRMERSARSESDFNKVTEMWDKLDANRERRERDHEILLGDTPVDSVVEYSQATVIPRWRNDPTEHQLQSGNFLDYLFDCPYEMHDLLSREYIRKAVFSLKEEHRELLFFLYLRLYSPQRLATMRDQTDRNIRKVRDVVLRKLRKRVYRDLDRLKKKGCPYITRRELEFLETFDMNGRVRKQ